MTTCPSVHCSQLIIPTLALGERVRPRADIDSSLLAMKVQASVKLSLVQKKNGRQHPLRCALICQFMKGALHLFHIWSITRDLQLELDVLLHPPFGPLDEVDLKILSFKTVLLLALALANHVTDIHAFLVYLACM